MENLMIKINAFIDNKLKTNKLLKNISFMSKQSTEIEGLELIYKSKYNDTDEFIEKIYNIISDIFYDNYIENGFTKTELRNVLIVYDYWDDIKEDPIIINNISDNLKILAQNKNLFNILQKNRLEYINISDRVEEQKIIDRTGLGAIFNNKEHLTKKDINSGKLTTTSVSDKFSNLNLNEEFQNCFIGIAS